MKLPLPNFITTLRIKQKFRQEAKVFLGFLRTVKFDSFQYEQRGKTYWVIVTPWMFTAVPWYALTIALLVRQRGKEVVIIWDDLEFDELATETDGASHFQNDIISKTLSYLSIDFKIVKLSMSKELLLTQEDRHELVRLSEISSIHKYQTSIPSNASIEYSRQWLLLQEKNLRKIKGFFNDNQCDYLIMPGGVYGNSGLFFYAFDNPTNIISYDSGFTRALICVNGITGYQSDMPFCMMHPEIRQMSNASFKEIERLSKEELHSRMQGTDFYATQVTRFDKSDIFDYDIIMPLNITWDLPALGKHRFFQTDYDWIIETLEFILKNTKARVAVRQHPHERRHKSGKDFAAKIIELFASNERVRFFKCDEEINTYRLIEGAKLVLPYVSTIGIEAAMLGKTVVMESDAYYSNFSFVKRAQSKQDYFNKISFYLEESSIKMTCDEYRDTILAYYLTQMCTAETTIFTPHPVNYADWVKRGFDNLSDDPSVKLIVDAIVQKVPVTILKHRQFMKNVVG